MSKGKDILTQYIKMANKEAGRRGYCDWKRTKDTVISPKKYGQFLYRKNSK